MYIISYIIVASLQFDSQLITNIYNFVLWNWTKITLCHDLLWEYL